MNIRQETAQDYHPVFDLIASAFADAEHTDHQEHHLVTRLRTSDAFIPQLSLVAEQDGQIVGHILFTQIRIGTHVSLALAPVSVLPSYQGSGIGGALIEKGHEIAKALGYGSCVVLGHPAYYPRFGYLPASRFGISAPFEVPDDCFMAVELIPHALDGISGMVAYAEEFGI